MTFRLWNLENAPLLEDVLHVEAEEEGVVVGRIVVGPWNEVLAQQVPDQLIAELELGPGREQVAAELVTRRRCRTVAEVPWSSAQRAW